MRRLIPILALTLAIAACGDDDSGGDTTEAPIPTDNVQVTIVGFSFGPGEVSVPIGTAVTWVNEEEGGIGHTSTSSDGAWSSGTLGEGEEFAFTFTETGTFSYFCSIHPEMVGTVVVG